MLSLFFSTYINFTAPEIPSLIELFPNNKPKILKLITQLDYGYEPTKDLINDLRKGGYIIFFRHTATDMKQKDTDRNLNNCAGQRNLNEQGRRDAQAIAEAFRQLRIPIGTVLSSPFCRTLETAQLAFGKAIKSEALTSVFYDGTQTPTLIESLGKLLLTLPQKGTNTILVGHGVNLEVAMQVSLAEGGAAIFRPKADGTLVLVEQIQQVKAWEKNFARLKIFK